ncbi:MAG: hypothetical protein V3U42_00770 [candidate division NC10 bacterium]
MGHPLGQVVHFLDQLAIGIVTRGRPGVQGLPLGDVAELDSGDIGWGWFPTRG